MLDFRQKSTSKGHNMRVVTITQANIHIYLNLAQCYEAEFSAITLKKPNEMGVFELDTQIGEGVEGLLLLVDEIPAAIAAIAIKGDARYEVCEFYVIPSFRNNAIGRQFAHMIWRRYYGEWEIKQIEGAEYASEFWRKSISAFERTTYREDRYEDPYWGVVTRQQFRV